jgi:hypothetical protein
MRNRSKLAELLHFILGLKYMQSVIAMSLPADEVLAIHIGIIFALLVPDADHRGSHIVCVPRDGPLPWLRSVVGARLSHGNRQDVQFISIITPRERSRLTGRNRACTGKGTTGIGAIPPTQDDGRTTSHCSTPKATPAAA